MNCNPFYLSATPVSMMWVTCREAGTLHHELHMPLAQDVEKLKEVIWQEELWVRIWRTSWNGDPVEAGRAAGPAVPSKGGQQISDMHAGSRKAWHFTSLPSINLAAALLLLLHKFLLWLI